MAPEQSKESWIQRAASNPHVNGGNISVLGSHLVAASSEFLGTFFFLWLGYGGQLMALTQAAAPAGQSGGASSQTVVFISLIYSFSLLVNAWAFYRISGGLFNPAVSLFSRERACEQSALTISTLSGLSGSQSCWSAPLDPNRIPHPRTAVGIDVCWRFSRGDV